MTFIVACHFIHDIAVERSTDIGLSREPIALHSLFSHELVTIAAAKFRCKAPNQLGQLEC